MRIRVAGPTEWRTWRALRLRALADSPDAFGETLDGARARDEAAWASSTATDPARVVLIAEDAGGWIGTAVARVTPDDRCAHLYAMWVAPEARRRGVGRALVDAAMRWSRFAGAGTMALKVTDRAPAAAAMYRALGFAPVTGGATEAVRPGSEIPSRILVAQLGPLVMGVVNTTPDSFSDGGDYLDPELAIAHGLALIRAGADLVDVGGEATNPKATPVDAAEEWRRIEPVIRGLAAAGATVSVDTTKAVVARAAAEAGASIINDVSGGLFDPEMSSMLAGFGGTYIAGHLRGTTLTEVFAAEGSIAASPITSPITWREVAAELADRLAALPASIRGRVWVDPGVGFGKGADPEGNLALLRHAGDLGRAVGCPVVVGPSRKRFLRRIVARSRPGTVDLTAVTLEELDAASTFASLGAARAGAHVVRVHNVALLRAALAVYTRM
jgi:dihydropteroate synthase